MRCRNFIQGTGFSGGVDTTFSKIYELLAFRLEH